MNAHNFGQQTDSMTLEDFEGRCNAIAWALEDYPEIVSRDIGDLFNIVKE